MTAAPADVEPAQRAATWTLFAVLFAVALICQQLWWNGFELTTPRTVVVAAAVWLLLRPASVGRFALLVGLEVAVLVAALPFVLSHLVVVLVAGAASLARLAVETCRARGRVDAAAAEAALGGFLRLTLLVVYVVAGVAKLNAGFLDPATSCAGPMTAAITWWAPGALAPPGGIGPAIVGTIVVELGLPILLAVPRARPVGLVVGGGFHLVLAAAGNVPFTALAFAFYALFLPPAAVRRIELAVRRALPRSGPPRRVATVLAAVLAAAAWTGGAALQAAAPGVAAALVGDGTRLLVLLVAALATAALVAGDRTPAGRALRVRSPILVAGLIVLLLDGASPYLGFKTESSLEMFSGLRTEPGAWNHVLVPETVRLGDLQEPLRVVSASDPTLVARTAGVDRLARGEVERAVRAAPGTAAVVETADGARTVVGPFAGGPSLADRVAWFRDVPPASVPRC